MLVLANILMFSRQAVKRLLEELTLTWRKAHNRQLFVPIRVHRDQILRVGIEHKPPAQIDNE